MLFRVRGRFPHFTPAPHLLGLRKTQVFQRKIGLVGRHRESNTGLAWYSASTLPLRYGGVRNLRHILSCENFRKVCIEEKPEPFFHVGARHKEFQKQLAQLFRGFSPQQSPCPDCANSFYTAVGCLYKSLEAFWPIAIFDSGRPK